MWSSTLTSRILFPPTSRSIISPLQRSSNDATLRNVIAYLSKSHQTVPTPGLFRLPQPTRGAQGCHLLGSHREESTYTSFHPTLGDRGFLGCEPIIGAMIDVAAPSIGRKSEILCQQIRKLSWSFTREDALYQVLMIRISFWLPQEDPPTWLGAEYIFAPLCGEYVRSILARSAGA